MHALIPLPAGPAMADALDSELHPEKLVTVEIVLTKEDLYTARLASGGGQVIHLNRRDLNEHMYFLLFIADFFTC